MKQKTGLFTWLGDGNYGTALQSYALYSAICRLGREVYVLSHKSPRHELRKLSIKKRTNARACHISRFQKERMRICTSWSGAKLRMHNPFTSVYVCGSDQMWNTWHRFNPYNFLSFAGDVKRVAYAPSLGATSFEPGTKDAVKALLARFSHISLREESSAVAVRELTGRSDVKTVLDPVFLLGKADWDGIASMASVKDEGCEPYILCYLLGQRDWSDAIADIKAQSGIDKVAVVPAIENLDICIDGADYFPDAGIPEFLQLVQKASLVVTDSFHATAFSVIFHRQFVEMRRFREDDPASQNSRISCLLASLGIQSRMQNEGKWTERINYTTVDQILDELRKDSLDYLEKALED